VEQRNERVRFVETDVKEYVDRGKKGSGQANGNTGEGEVKGVEVTNRKEINGELKGRGEEGSTITRPRAKVGGIWGSERGFKAYYGKSQVCGSLRKHREERTRKKPKEQSRDGFYEKD